MTKPKPGAQIDPAHPLSKGLVGHWLFNEGAGSLASDISGKKNHGHLKNMAPNAQNSGWGGSRYGGELRFDGSNDHVELPVGVASGLYQVSVGGWVNLTTSGGDSAFFGGWGTPSQLLLYEDDPYGWRFVVQDGTTRDSGFGNPVTNGQWIHVVGTYDANKSICVYENGILTASDGNPPIGKPILTTAQTIKIGTDVVGSRPLHGLISSCFMYDRALSVAEVNQLYEYSFCNILYPRRWYVLGAPPVGAIMNQFQKSNIGADLFNGGIIA